MKDVYYYIKTAEISFHYEPNQCVCFGETDGTLDDFLGFMRQDWLSRGLDIAALPKIRRDDI